MPKAARQDVAVLWLLRGPLPAVRPKVAQPEPTATAPGGVGSPVVPKAPQGLLSLPPRVCGVGRRLLTTIGERMTVGRMRMRTAKGFTGRAVVAGTGALFSAPSATARSEAAVWNAFIQTAAASSPTT